jgi:hypothetical protein
LGNPAKVLSRASCSERNPIGDEMARHPSSKVVKKQCLPHLKSRKLLELYGTKSWWQRLQR